MSNIRSFRELKVWQRAMDAAMEVLRMTKEFPAYERYSLTDQVRRSSRSVAANIAYEEVLGMLVRMISRPDDWSLSPSPPPRVSASTKTGQTTESNNNARQCLNKKVNP